jgi:outer membrane protein assembly factor BamB
VSQVGRRTSSRVVIVMLAALLPVVASGTGPAAAAVAAPRFVAERAHLALAGRSLVVADFTGDGLLDVVTKVEWSMYSENAYRVYLWARTPDGRLEERARLATSQTEPVGILGFATADFDADGRADVAVPSGAGLDLFFQRDGTLGGRMTVEVPGARQVDAADVDGDGRSDLVVAGNGGVSLLRATGPATFAPPVPITSRSQSEIEVGDVTGDGRPDIVGIAPSYFNQGRAALQVMRQLESGAFAPPRDYATSGEKGIALGDFTGDGLGDVAQTVGGNRPGSALMVTPQRNDGTLGPAVYYASYDIPEPLEAADVNGDGRLDLVTLHDAWEAVGVYVQQEDGTMAAEQLFATAYANYDVNSLAVTDLTGDGLPDLVYTAGTRIMVLAGLPPVPPPTSTSTTASVPTSTTRPPATTTTTTTTVPVGSTGQTTAFQINAAHTGSLHDASGRPPLVKRWSLDLGAPVGFPLIAQGIVFALANTAHAVSESTLYAVDAATGNNVWGPLDLGQRATYTYGAGQIFVITWDGMVRSFDAASGRQKWLTQVTSQRYFDGPPLYRDGVLYFGGHANGASLFALSTVDGHELWSRPIADGAKSAPAAGDELVFTSHACAAATGWRPETGVRVWGVNSACSGIGTNYTPAVADGLLWTRGMPSRLPGAYDVRTGERVVTFTADAAPAIDGANGYFLAGGVLEARQTRTQIVRWTFSGDGQLTSAPIVVNGFVYAASASGQIWALDGETGEVAWTDNVGAPVRPPGENPGISGLPPTGLGAGQGVVVVPATNLLVAYAPAGSTPASAGPRPPRTVTGTGATATPAGQAGNVRMGTSGQAWVEGGPGAPPLRTRWTREMGAQAEYAVAGAGKVFVGDGTRLLALDADTGEDAWPPFTFPSEFPNSQNLRVAYGDGRVFVVPNEGAVRAFDAGTGRVLWSSDLPGGHASAPLYSRGIVYFAHQGTTYALSAVTGRELWRQWGGSSTHPPLLAGNVLYAATGCPKAVDAFTGQTKWDAIGCPTPGDGPPVVVGERLWQAGDSRNTPRIRDAATGAVTAGFGGRAPAFDSSRAYVLDGHAVKAKDPVTQFTLWTFAPGEELVTAPVVIDSYVYARSVSGRVWALDPATGAPVWSGETGGRFDFPYHRGGVGINITAGPGLVLVPGGYRLVAFEAVDPPPPPPAPSKPAAFGFNALGGLGDGTTVTRPAPVDVGLTDVVEVAAGGYHTLGRRADGTVWAWGWNGVGQLGDGTTVTRSTPVRVPGLANVVSISAGVFHSLAVTADGSVWSWGWNIYGQLGDGTTTDRWTPVKVAGLTGVVHAAGGGLHSAALGRDGVVSSWGWNAVGQLGLGTTTDHLTPVTVPGLGGVSAIAAGWFQTTALRPDGTVWAWGFNHVGQLGDGTTVDRHSPVRLAALTNVVAVTSGVYHGLAIHDDGTVSAWGWNGFGQLGDGTTIDRRAPVKVPGLRGATAVSAGGYHSLALLTHGSVVSWGWNAAGQLGDGTLKDQTAPVPVPALSGIESLAGGLAHSMASDNP